MPLVGIINYGIGNIGSVQAALNQIKVDSFLIQKPEDFDRATHVILPGVGAFGAGMKNLIERDFVKGIRERVVSKNKPLLGICLGMQLLATKGLEFGEHDGLDVIPGQVIKLEVGNLRLPHVGWNDIRVSNPDSVVTQEFESQAFYFVHSFHFVTENPSDTTAVTNYGLDFAACVSHGNVFGAQFHPEKSQKWGLELLKNFSKLGGT